jgi:lipopolysaccharide transport system permease protein
MVGIIDGFRWCLLGETPQDWWSIATSLALSLMMLAIGVSYFRKTEKKFADII